MHCLGFAALLAVLPVFLTACGGGVDAGGREDGSESASLGEVALAAERTVDAGASEITVEVDNGVAGYKLRGRVDFSLGYRACVWVDEARGARSVSFPAGTLLWLAGDEGTITYGNRRGSWDHVLKGPSSEDPPRCTEGGGWLDDHPPTLALYRSRDPFHLPPGGSTGAESYVHLALMAITRFDEGALRLVPGSDSGDSVEVEIDFSRYDQEPPSRDEDAWEVRPLLQAAKTIPVRVGLDEDGRLTGVEFEAPSTVHGNSSGGPVGVSVALSAIGEARRVPKALVTAME